MRLLIVEDEEDIAEPLKRAFEKRKYAVDYAEDGEKGLYLAQINTYDCVILDLNLPKMDGLEVAKKLRDQEKQVPILMLTARMAQGNIIEGFESGTDDYMTKPFHFKELVLRVEALIRRNSFNRSEELEKDDVKIDANAKRVFVSDKEIELNAKEYGILEYLMRNKGRIVTQEELLEHVWNQDIDMLTQTVRTNIKTLRKKVDPEKSLIETVKGQGYIIK